MVAPRTGETARCSTGSDSRSNLAPLVAVDDPQGAVAALGTRIARTPLRTAQVKLSRWLVLILSARAASLVLVRLEALRRIWKASSSSTW